MSRKKTRIAPNGEYLSPKEDRIISFMNKHKSISAAQAESELHDHRLSGSIHTLRKKGYDIETVRVDITNVYGEDTWYGKYMFKKHKS